MVLKVVIIGGGIAGLSTAIALQRHPGVRVQLHEQADEFREVGALLGVAPNGLRTLEKLGVHEALGDEVGWKSPNGIHVLYRHYKTNEILHRDLPRYVPDRKHHFARVHRAKLQQALLNHLPKDILHTGKRAIGVEVDQRGATVRFNDGTSATGDIVVGADGIKSKVRRAFVPDLELSWSSDAIFRTTFPYSLVADLDVPQNTTHYHAPDRWIFVSRLGSEGYGVTATFHVDEDDPNAKFKDNVWNVPADVEDFREKFKDFYPPIPEIIDRIPPGTLRRFVNLAGPALKTWTFGGRVILLGDAAHAHGAAYGAGSSLAIDDAYTLYLSIRAVFAEALPIDEPVPAAKVARALDLFESARRPHAERAVNTVVEQRANAATHFDVLRDPNTPEAEAAFRARFVSPEDPSWLHEHDADAAFRKVLLEKAATPPVVNGYNANDNGEVAVARL